MSARTRDMTTGSPGRLIFSFALPLMVGNVFQQLYTMVDAMVVGNAVGVRALAALGAADWSTWMVLGIITGFAQGFSIPVAQYFGAGDHRAIRRVVCNAVLISAGLTVLLTALSLSLSSTILNLLNTPEEVYAEAHIYMIILYSGVAAQMAYNLQASILRALGNSRTPLTAMIIASLTNIALDILFVVGFGWGIAGAAAATIFSQGVSAAICFMAIRKIDVLLPAREDWRPDRSQMVGLLRLGLPLAFQNAIIAIGGIIVQKIINGFGVVFIAGFTATNKLYGLLELAATSFGFSLTTYTGQNLGARKPERVRTGVRAGLIMGIATAAVISGCMLLFGRQIVGLFVSDSPEIEARAIGVAFSYLKIMSCFLPILYLLHIYRSALYGFGDTVVPMLSGIAELIMRVAIIMTLPGLIGEQGAYYAEVAAWAGAAAILAIAYYYRLGRLPLAVTGPATPQPDPYEGDNPQ